MNDLKYWHFCTFYDAKNWLLLPILVMVVVIGIFEVYFPSSNRVVSLPCSREELSVDNNKSERLITETPKIILLWTTWFDQIDWDEHIDNIGGDTVSVISTNALPNRTCRLVSDRRHFDKASAIIFHGRDLNFNDLPETRNPIQRWVFFLLESPHHSGFNDTTWHLASQLQFNWTMYYTFASDSRYAYGYVNPVKYSEQELVFVNEKISQFAQNFSSRPYDAVWFTSHCSTPSRRGIIAKQFLAAGLKIDLWGTCFGRKPDDELLRLGEKAFFSRYRYQFAMENSICDDYASEKLFNALKNSEKYGVIPVVFGGADYNKIAVPGSFIDATRRPANVVKLMKHLARPDQVDAVRSYFQWQTHSAVDKKTYSALGWESLCEKLWDSSEPPKTVTNLRPSLGRCVEDVYWRNRLKTVTIRPND